MGDAFPIARADYRLGGHQESDPLAVCSVISRRGSETGGVRREKPTGR